MTNKQLVAFISSFTAFVIICVGALIWFTGDKSEKNVQKSGISSSENHEVNNRTSGRKSNGYFSAESDTAETTADNGDEQKPADGSKTEEGTTADSDKGNATGITDRQPAGTQRETNTANVTNAPDTRNTTDAQKQDDNDNEIKYKLELCNRNGNYVIIAGDYMVDYCDDGWATIYEADTGNFVKSFSSNYELQAFDGENVWFLIKERDENDCFYKNITKYNMKTDKMEIIAAVDKDTVISRIDDDNIYILYSETDNEKPGKDHDSTDETWCFSKYNYATKKETLITKNKWSVTPDYFEHQGRLYAVWHKNGICDIEIIDTVTGKTYCLEKNSEFKKYENGKIYYTVMPEDYEIGTYICGENLIPYKMCNPDGSNVQLVDDVIFYMYRDENLVWFNEFLDSVTREKYIF